MTIGFLVGISAHILISQLPVILGLPSPQGPMLQRLATLAEHIGQANNFTLVIGLGVLAIIALSEQIDARIPGALIGLALASAAVVLLRLESRGVSVLGTVSVNMPALAVPVVSIGQLASLLSLSLIVSIIVMVQSAATTRSFPSDPNEPPDVDRDFVGVGAGSVLSGLIGSFPVDASPPRTAVVSETGGRSQLAGIAAVAIVVMLLAFGASLLHQIPNAALGGVLLFVALRIIRFGQIVTIYRQSPGEFLLILLTAAAIIVLPIEQGVGIGIALSLLHGIWSTTRARVQIFERVAGTAIWWPSVPVFPASGSRVSSWLDSRRRSPFSTPITSGRISSPPSRRHRKRYGCWFWKRPALSRLISRRRKSWPGSYAAVTPKASTLQSRGLNHCARNKPWRASELSS